MIRKGGNSFLKWDHDDDDDNVDDEDGLINMAVLPLLSPAHQVMARC